MIKVERPTAGDAGRQHAYFIDGQSGYFLQQNMGKKGLCINLKDPRGLEMMHKLTDSADVFVENYRPGALEQAGPGLRGARRRAIPGSSTARSRPTATPGRTRTARASG